MKTVARILLLSAGITSTLVGMKKDTSDLGIFCRQHVPFYLAQLEKEYKKISVTNLSGAFIKKYIAAQKALEELKNHKETKPKSKIRKRALSDSQKRTMVRNKIVEEEYGMHFSDKSDESDSDSDSDSSSLSSLSDSEDEITRKIDTIKLI